jgi:hypothetical protein
MNRSWGVTTLNKVTLNNDHVKLSFITKIKPIGGRMIWSNGKTQLEYNGGKYISFKTVCPYDLNIYILKKGM